MSYRPTLVAAALALAAVTAAGCASATDGDPSAATAPSTSARPSPRPSPPHTVAPTTTPPSSASSSSTPVSTHPVPSAPLSTKTATGSDGTVYAVSIWAEQNSADCAAHAYGQVAQFVATRDCRGIRQVLATTAIDGRAVGFEQNAVSFGGTMDSAYRAAGQFRDLVASDGTGNLNDLLREGYRLPAGPDHVPSPDAFSALGQDNGVDVVDAWYLDGATPANDPALVKMAEDIFLQI
jgi:hypothetical protein